MNDKAQRFKKFNKALFNLIDQKGVEKIIVDIRHNLGGASWIVSPFFRALKKRPHLNKSNKLYVIIGRKTFSSAMMCTIRFMKKTHATLAGEGTGATPNGYGELFNLKLMNTGYTLYYSTQYFKQLDEDINCIEPALAIASHAADYFNNHDEVLQVIKNHSMGV